MSCIPEEFIVLRESPAQEKRCVNFRIFYCRAVCEDRGILGPFSRVDLYPPIFFSWELSSIRGLQRRAGFLVLRVDGALVIVTEIVTDDIAFCGIQKIKKNCFSRK